MMIHTGIILLVAISCQLIDASGRSRELEITPKIIGGDFVQANTYPWFARATIGTATWAACGGALVTPEFILTAAHCIKPDSDLNFETRGGYDIGALCNPYVTGANCGQRAEFFKVKKVTLHPGWTESNYDNDYAVIQLRGKSTIAPVAFDDGTYSPNYAEGKGLWAIGLGLTTNVDGSEPSRLKHAKLSYISNYSCHNNHHYSEASITDQMMCTMEDGKDACTGDSGGPLYDAENNVLVGITSWGQICADPDYPGVFARISTRYDWIRKVICDDHTESTTPQLCIDPTESPSGSPTSSTSPTMSPTASFKPTTSLKPSPSPTKLPTSLPTDAPSSTPTSSPTAAPISPPTMAPSPKPTLAPVEKTKTSGVPGLQRMSTFAAASSIVLMMMMM